ncbi:hypothetical protein DFH06DRAFT_652342 [Mycena polygramma]|nr:hypothetical protein DFH06DRAFT_652342 [Mycena polygramma]
MTPRSWYKNNHEACEYAAWHVLEIYKGPEGSLFSTDLVMVSLAMDPEAPNDPSKIKLKDMFDMPRKELYKSTRMKQSAIDACERAAHGGFITLVFIDIKNGTTCTTTIMPPPTTWRKPEKLWLGYVHLMVGGHIAKLAAELEAAKGQATS